MFTWYCIDREMRSGQLTLSVIDNSFIQIKMNLIPSIHDGSIEPIAQMSIGTEDRGLAGKDLNLELYSAGFIDGLTGLNAELPHFRDYWDGYSLGYREYCCGLLGEEIVPEEIPASAVEALIN